MAPPAYNDTCGGLSDEKPKSSTGAQTTDDGLGDIRISGLGRRMSQLFNPPFRQQVDSAQASNPAPQPYIPPSLDGDKDGNPLPALNVVMQVVGSRGDVQPFTALGKVLKNTYGENLKTLSAELSQSEIFPCERAVGPCYPSRRYPY